MLCKSMCRYLQAAGVLILCLVNWWGANSCPTLKTLIKGFLFYIEADEIICILTEETHLHCKCVPFEIFYIAHGCLIKVYMPGNKIVLNLCGSF